MKTRNKCFPVIVVKRIFFCPIQTLQASWPLKNPYQKNSCNLNGFKFENSHKPGNGFKFEIPIYRYPPPRLQVYREE